MENEFKDVDLPDVFMELRESIKSEIRVASLGYFVDITTPWNEEKGYGIATVRPFPLIEGQTEYTMNCYFVKERTEFPPIVVIIFMDLNFASNLKSTEKKPKTTKSNLTHSGNYGIIL